MTRLRGGITSTISIIASFVAVTVALSLPLGYYSLSYQQELGAIKTEAIFRARSLTRHVNSNPVLWAFQSVRIIELLKGDNTNSDLPGRHSIIDEHHVTVGETGPPLPQPILSWSSPIYDSGQIVAHVVIERSLKPLIVDTAIVAGLGFLLGLSVFITLRILPMRALQRAIEAQRRSDQLFRKAFDASPEPLSISLLDSGRVLDVNESFLNLSGYQRGEVIGRSTIELGLWVNQDDYAALHSALCADRTARDLEFDFRTKSGELRSLLVSAEVIEIDAQLCLLMAARDTTERKLVQARLSFLANYDSLTGLPNRSLFHDRLSQALRRSDRHQRMVALLFLDLDHFKTVNDSLGHTFGDQLLQLVAQRLKQSLRLSDTITYSAIDEAESSGVTVSRLGGDEFTIILEDIHQVEHAAMVASRVIDAIAHPFMVENQEIYASASIGITVYPLDKTTADQLIKHADVAMYRAKELGRANYQFYTEDLNTRAQQRLLLEAGLRHALERNEFSLHYQPKIDVSSGKVLGVEALIRWNHPERGLIPPVTFIPILEETGLIVHVGAWVLRHACNQIAAWQRQGIPQLHLAVNLSPRQFRQDRLTEIVAECLTDTGILPSQLELEVTESLLMDNTELSITMLSGLRAMGVKVAVDDFGTGYSSLNYLRRFPIDILKIDKSFVCELTSNADDAAIATAIIALAHSLRLTVIAEGVETEAQLNHLRRQGCDQAQGFFISRPLPAEACLAWIQSRTMVTQLPEATTLL